MKILIIGGSSSLGEELKKHLSKNHEITTVGRSNCDIFLDLSITEEINSSASFDVAIMTAAVFGGNNFYSCEENININVTGTLRSIHFAQKVNAKHFVLISSMSAIQSSDSPFHSIYSITKKHSEDIAEFMCNSISMPLTILRPSQLYCENESFKKHQPLLYHIIYSVKKNEPIILQGKHNAVRNYLNVVDFIKIIERVIELKTFGKFNCVYPQNTSLSELTHAAIIAFDSTSKVEFDKSKNDIPDNGFIFDNLLYSKINFTPKININAGMRLISNSIK